MTDAHSVLSLASVVEQGVLFKTGVPVTFRFIRNTEKSSSFGSTYQQDIEPAGRYMVHNEEPGDLVRGWESGIVSFERPLVLELTTDDRIYGPNGWKARLAAACQATGAALSRRLLADGFDGIVTVGQFTHLGRTTKDTREIVDLRPLRLENPRILPCRDYGCACAGRGHPCAGACRDVDSCRCGRCSLCRKLCVESDLVVDSEGDPVGETCCGSRLDSSGNLVGNPRRPGRARVLGAELFRRRRRRNPPTPEDCQRIQDWLFDYLSTDVDPYDFPQYFLSEWAEEAGLQEIADDPDSMTDGLTDEQRKDYTAWLIENDAKYRWVKEDPFGSAPYITLTSPEKLGPGTWCVHFTNSLPFDSFDRGATLEGLHLSSWSREKSFVKCPNNLDFENVGLYEMVFGFAFKATDFTGGRARGGFGSFRNKQKKYGKTALLFRVDCAVEAYHTGDEEQQVIFPLCAERDVVAFDMRGDGAVWTDVNYDDEEGEKLFPSLAALIESLS